MLKLTEELSREHAHLSDTLLRVQHAGIGTKQGRELLITAKEELFDHLEKKDQQLYPALRRAAKRDESLKEALDKYARDMDQISAAALAFFHKYCDTDVEERFEEECKTLIRVLCKRIHHEETVLYKKYDEIMG